MSEPERLFDYLANFDTSEVPEDDAERRRKVVQASVAAHIAGLEEMRRSILDVDGRDPAITLALGAEINSELQALADNEEHKRDS